VRLLIVNPNTTDAVTDLLVNAGRHVAAPDTELVPLTAPRGMPYISTRAEAQIGGAIALEMLAEHHGNAEAAIIAAFGDPGLFAARELFDIPVIGMSEAAMLTARMLGKRFAVVTFTKQLVGWFRDCVDMHQMAPHCVAVRAITEPFASMISVQVDKEDLLVELALRAVEEDDADVIILAGAPLAGLAQKVRERIPVPVVDPIAAAVKQAEALVALSPRKAVAGSFRRPAAKSTKGLDDVLAARIEHRDVRPAAE
jgi:Asp/Glu/hydantoin racemase